MAETLNVTSSSLFRHTSLAVTITTKRRFKGDPVRNADWWCKRFISVNPDERATRQGNDKVRTKFVEGNFSPSPPNASDEHHFSLSKSSCLLPRVDEHPCCDLGREETIYNFVFIVTAFFPCLPQFFSSHCCVTFGSTEKLGKVNSCVTLIDGEISNSLKFNSERENA